MPTLEFFKLSPGGNMTLLFEGKGLTPAQQHLVAAEALSAQHLGAEQVGFCSVAEGTLHMGGGEFCLNATRSLGLLMALRQGFAASEDKEWHGKARVSGLNEEVPLVVRRAADAYEVFVTLSLNPEPQSKSLSAGIELVTLPGISHLLLADSVHPFPSTSFRDESENLRHRFHQSQENAVGCIWWRQSPAPHNGSEQDDDTLYLHAEPVVYVRAPRSLCHERSCGSGALALALALYQRTGREVFSVMQPGGSPLTVTLAHQDIKEAEDTGQSSTLTATVGGVVHLVAEGTAYFQSPLA